MKAVRSFVLSVLAAVALHTGELRAQTYITARSVFLRGSPSKTGAKLRELEEGDTLTRRTNVQAHPGWLPVRTTDGKAGWVGLVHLRSLDIAAAASATSVVTDAGGAAFTAIDSTWQKPAIHRSTILVRGGAMQCGATGDAAHDDGTNLHKNRADIPTSSHLVTVDAIRSLPDTALWRFTDRQHWIRSDSALVLPYEGIPVTVEGFFEVVKPQKDSPPHGSEQVGEAPNCHSWTEDDTDWHVALVANPSEIEERAIVVEPTPRTKRHHAAWIASAVSQLAVRHSTSSGRDEAGAARVRVTGFLLLDPVHPNHIRGHCTADCATKHFFRATLWEVHPVTRIEIFRNGTWSELLPP
jgi:hypothetical protein